MFYVAHNLFIDKSLILCPLVVEKLLIIYFNKTNVLLQ